MVAHGIAGLQQGLLLSEQGSGPLAVNEVEIGFAPQFGWVAEAVRLGGMLVDEDDAAQSILHILHARRLVQGGCEQAGFRRTFAAPAI